MEQEGITLIIITTIIVLVSTIAMIVFFVVFQNLKNKLLVDNRNLREGTQDKASTFKLE